MQICPCLQSAFSSQLFNVRTGSLTGWHPKLKSFGLPVEPSLQIHVDRWLLETHKAFGPQENLLQASTQFLTPRPNWKQISVLLQSWSISHWPRKWHPLFKSLASPIYPNGHTHFPSEQAARGPHETPSHKFKQRPFSHRYPDGHVTVLLQIQWSGSSHSASFWTGEHIANGFPKNPRLHLQS